MYRSVANKNGTIEVNGNTFRFSQPADEFKTDDLQKIEISYSEKLEFIADDPHYITARNIEQKNGQVIFEYDLTDLKMFDYLRTLFFKEKLVYYKSLIEIAKRDKLNEVSTLWHKDNFVIDPTDKTVKTLIIEHDLFELQEKRDTLAALKEIIIISLTAMNKVLGKPRRADFIEDKEEVIHFAEKVYLKANSIEAIEEYVNAELLHMEMQEKEEQEQKQNQSKFAAFSEKLKAKAPKKNSEEKERTSMISKLKQEPEGSPSNKKKKEISNNKLFLGVGGAILGAVLLSGFLTSTTDQQASADVEETVQPEVEITTIYRDALFEEPEITLEKLEKIGYENLAEEDQAAMNQLYVDAGNYEKAMANDPTIAGKIAKDFYEKEEVKKLEEFVNGLDEKNHEASFYLDLANENWKQVIARTDELDKLNDEQVNHILTAYFQLGDVEGANEFLGTVKEVSAKTEERMKLANELNEKIILAEEELAELEEKLDNTDKKKTKKAINKDIDKVKEDIESMESVLKTS